MRCLGLFCLLEGCVPEQAALGVLLLRQALLREHPAVAVVAAQGLTDLAMLRSGPWCRRVPLGSTCTDYVTNGISLLIVTVWPGSKHLALLWSPGDGGSRLRAQPVQQCFQKEQPITLPLEDAECRWGAPKTDFQSLQRQPM